MNREQMIDEAVRRAVGILGAAALGGHMKDLPYDASHMSGCQFCHTCLDSITTEYRRIVGNNAYG